MKTRHSYAVTLLTMLSAGALAQGTFIYDQQSADETTHSGSSGPIQSNQPFGQSFIPTLNTVNFIRLYLSDQSINGLGATVYVNLRTDAINGPVLGTSAPVSMPDGFRGFPDFFFTVPVTVTPGVTYYFQPVLQSGDNTWEATGYHYGYPGGSAYALGAPDPATDFWFREGIVVPEPATWALLLFGCGLLAWRKRLFP